MSYIAEHEIRIVPPEMWSLGKPYSYYDEDKLEKITELEDYIKMLHEHIYIFCTVGEGDYEGQFEYAKYMDILKAWTDYFKREEEKKDAKRTCPTCGRQSPDHDKNNPLWVAADARMVKPKRNNSRRRSNRGAKKQGASVRSKKQNRSVRSVKTKRKGRNRRA